MRIKYLGVMETKSGGCIPCGARKASKKAMATRKEFQLHSGGAKTFYFGRETEVLDDDGRHLIEAFPDAFEEVV